jgi:phosphoribosylaminoimidazole-succinocarboxamide synthase
MIPPLFPATDLPGLKLVKRGKVRDIYDVGEHLLLVSTDRVSAFDVVLPTAIPYKGAVLNRLSAFWFRLLADAFPNHFVTDRIEEMPGEVRAHREVLEGRAMLVRRVKVVPIECVVRGYIAGSVVSEYQAKATIGGVAVPRGLRVSDQLPVPVFTPTTKAETGHDEPLSMAEVETRVGRARAQELAERSRALYRAGRDHAADRGLILCDTKFEWGEAPDGRLLLADEVLTPDSSRYWVLDAYQPGRPQDPLDKQLVRNWLLDLGWDKSPPAPALPPEVVADTTTRYLRLFRLLTGEGLA